MLCQLCTFNQWHYSFQERKTINRLHVEFNEADPQDVKGKYSHRVFGYLIPPEPGNTTRVLRVTCAVSVYMVVRYIDAWIHVYTCVFIVIHVGTCTCAVPAIVTCDWLLYCLRENFCFMKRWCGRACVRTHHVHLWQIWPYLIIIVFICECCECNGVPSMIVY